MNELNLTMEEVNLMCMFDMSSRAALIADLRGIPDEYMTPELFDLVESVVARLEKIGDDAFCKLKLVPEYGDLDDIRR